MKKIIYLYIAIFLISLKLITFVSAGASLGDCGKYECLVYSCSEFGWDPLPGDSKSGCSESALVCDGNKVKRTASGTYVNKCGYSKSLKRYACTDECPGYGKTCTYTVKICNATQNCVNPPGPTQASCVSIPCTCNSVNQTNCSGTNYLTCNNACFWENNGEVSGECGVIDECDANQTIMKLYYPTNSHASMWNTPDYNYSICYPDLFGNDYIGANYHSCDSNNNVMIYLSDITNAHASTVQSSIYDKPVCYGNLFCSIKNTDIGENCAIDETALMRLSNISNAHISNAIDTNYPIKICCKNLSEAPLIGSNLFWTDMLGNPIANSNIGDSVYLIYNWTLFNFSLNIWEKDTITDDEIILGLGSRMMGDYARGFWRITSEDFIKGSDNGAESSEDFYFVSEGHQSALLHVQNYTNEMPTTRIIKPTLNSTYIINKSTNKTDLISFEQQSEDKDDLLKITWDFGNSITKTFNCPLTGNCETEDKYSNCNATGDYNNSGTKMIRISAEEASRSNIARQVTRIFVYKIGMNIHAVIDKPSIEQTIFDPGIYQIDGRSSIVTNCSELQVTCINAATAQGKTCDINITDANDPLLKLYCYRYADFNDPNLLFEWRVNGIKENTTAATFEKLFLESGNYIIDLKVRFTY